MFEKAVQLVGISDWSYAEGRISAYLRLEIQHRILGLRSLRSARIALRYREKVLAHSGLDTPIRLAFGLPNRIILPVYLDAAQLLPEISSLADARSTLEIEVRLVLVFFGIVPVPVRKTFRFSTGDLYAELRSIAEEKATAAVSAVASRIGSLVQDGLACIRSAL